MAEPSIAIQPDRGENRTRGLPTRPPRGRAVAALALVALTASCGGGEPGSTETAAASDLAVVWESAVDPNRVNTELPRPVWAVGETTVAIDLVGLVDNDPTAGDPGARCREAVESQDTDVDRCMLVQLRFSVGAEATDPGGVFVTHAVTVDGRRIEVLVPGSDRPGTVDNFVLFAVPGAGPGSTIVFNISGGLGIDSIEIGVEFVTPDADDWKPVDFLRDP